MRPQLPKTRPKKRPSHMGMTVTLNDTGQTLKDNQRNVDYTPVKSRSLSKSCLSQYREIDAFYNKELVVHYGNQVDPIDKLYTTELLDVIPMKDNDIITDIQANKVAINKLMLHFVDNTISYLDVTYKEDFKNTTNCRVQRSR